MSEGEERCSAIISLAGRISEAPASLSGPSGVTSRLAGPLGVGYHFQHYSDATLYGQDSRGVDLHLIELIYWFDRRE